MATSTVLYAYHAAYWRAALPLAGVLFVYFIQRLMLVLGITRVSSWTPIATVTVTLLGAAASIIVAVYTHTESQRVAQLLADGSAVTIEGRVAHFRPGKSKEHRPERFSLAGVMFEYVNYDGGPGFHETAGDGGPIQQNRCLRVVYYRDPYLSNRILRLESLAEGDSVKSCGVSTVQ